MRVIIKASGHQYRWLAGGYDLESRTSLEVASMVVTWWIVPFFAQFKLTDNTDIRCDYYTDNRLMSPDTLFSSIQCH